MTSPVPASLSPGRVFQFDESAHDYLWQALAGLDPKVVARNARVRWIEDSGFLVKMVGAHYLFDPAGRAVTGPDTRPAPDRRVALCLLHYLSGARPTGPSYRLAPETVLPGGDRFFAGGHALARRPVLEAFGADGPGFLEQARALGGQPVESQPGSHSFTMSLLPKIFVQVTMCEGDDEFPPELYYAFDPSAADHVGLGILAALIGHLAALLVAPKAAEI